MIPISPTQEIRYVPKADRDLPEDQQSVFVVTGMSARQDAEIRDSFGEAVQREDGIAYRLETACCSNRTLDFGLVGWENFPPGAAASEGFLLANEGKKNPLNRRLSDATLSMLDPDFRVELADEITKLSSLSKEQAKNSG